MTNLLNADEYLHLAIHAIAAGEMHASLDYLHRALQLEPNNARVTYLLAAQHLQLGLVERGLGGLHSALTMDPGLEVARFQLGLVLVGMNRRDEAEQQFAALIGSKDVALASFSKGMLTFAKGDRAAGLKQMAAGLAQSQSHPALAGLMQRIVTELGRADAKAPESVEHVLALGAYSNSNC